MPQQFVSRRGFLQQLGGAAATALMVKTGRGQTPYKPVFNIGDFAYVGAFRMPGSVGGVDAHWGRALTHRRVNNDLRFFSTTVGGGVYEVVYPGVARSAPYPDAQVVQNWGDVYSGKRFLDGNRGSGEIYGLYWDEPDQRLYWSYGEDYNAVSVNDPSLGYSKLNETAKTGQAAAVWRFTGRGAKATMGGVLSIPDWFAARYCQGKRLGAGFGGYFSIVGNGPAHMGPALCAFAPPNIETQPDRASLEHTALVGYPYNANAYTAPGRCYRNPNYQTEFDGWQPRDGVGHWTWMDQLWQGAVWIETGRKHGLLYFPTLGQGRVWYERSERHAERSSHWWYVYDPVDLATVAEGKREQWQIQPRQTWAVRYPEVDYTRRADGDHFNVVTGVTYDHVMRQLFVAVRFGWAVGLGYEYRHLVYVYRVHPRARLIGGRANNG